MQIFDEMVSDPSETGARTDEGTADFAEIKQKILGNRGKSTKRKTSAPSREEITAKELDEIFAGENWEEVAALYFNSRFAVTGWNGFLLTEGQKKTLGTSLGTTMKMLLKIDPGYVALIIFSANFGGLIAQKEVLYSKLLKEAEKKSGTKEPS